MWQYPDHVVGCFARSFLALPVEVQTKAPVRMMAIHRVILGLMSDEHEHRDGVYVIRLVAFLLIIPAIVDKNRTRKH
jgi:hypothetical protein